MAERTAEEIAEIKEKHLAAKKARVEKRVQLRDAALKYVEDFKAGDNKKLISLRIRDGYIGKELDDTGRKLQYERAKPRGTLVAIKGDKDGEIKIGYTYFSSTVSDIGIVGVAEALKNARGEKRAAKELKARDKDLYDFFEIRAKCFFWPEIYSHTRGTNKLTYPNYDKIHENRKRILGEDA